MTPAKGTSRARLLVRSLSRWRTWILLGACVAALVVAWQQWWLAGDFRIDDAYITFSFSKNLGTGHGPVYSHGLRVEGYSNFLWMVLLSIPFALGASDPYPFAHALGALSLGVVAIATYRLTRRRSAPIFAAGAVAMVLMATDLSRAARSGLETAAYTAALATATLCYLGESPRRRRTSLYGFVVVALFRIDGMVPLAFVLAFEVVSACIERRFSLPALARWAGPPLAVYAAYFAWRYHYYGLPLPSTYYAKQLVSSDPRRGIEYAWGAVRAFGVVATLPFVGLAIVRARRASTFLGLYVVCHVFYVIHVGGDWMPLDRFWLPVVPFVAVLTAWGFGDAWMMAQRHRLPVRLIVAVAIACSFRFTSRHASAATIETGDEAGKVGLSAFLTHHTMDELVGDVRFLRHVIREPGEKLVTDYAGVFGFYTDAYVIDMWGLTNATIAVRGNADGVKAMYGKTCVECYRELNPDYFHIVTPLIRKMDTFQTQAQVIAEVFQGAALDRVIGLGSNYAVGRVVEIETDRALWFLERRRPGISLRPRSPEPGMRVDYPFETRAAP